MQGYCSILLPSEIQAEMEMQGYISTPRQTGALRSACPETMAESLGTMFIHLANQTGSTTERETWQAATKLTRHRLG